jgi:hypothetical protein
MAYMTQPLGTFNGNPGLGLRIGKKKKKKAPARVVGAIAPVAAPKKKKKKKKSLIRRIGKGLLKVAPVAAGIFLPGAGAIAVGAASGAIGRGKPKLKRILRGAAIAGGTKIATNLIRSGQAGRILVRGKNALGAALRGGGKVVGKVGSTAGHIIENISKGDIGPAEGAVIGAGGGAAVLAAKKLFKKRGNGGDEQEGPAPPYIDDVAPPGTIPPPYEPGPGPELPSGPLPPEPSAPPSPTETPTAGTIPTAGGEVPSTAAGAMFPGSGGDRFAPAASLSPEEEAQGEVADDDGKKKMLLIALGIGAVLLIASKKKRGR